MKAYIYTGLTAFALGVIVAVSISPKKDSKPKYIRKEPIYFNLATPTPEPTEENAVESFVEPFFLPINSVELNYLSEELNVEMTANETNESISVEETEPKEVWYTILATAYTDAPEENGGFGAVDCRYGKPLIDGEHIAADLSFLPYGTKVYIEGLGERTVVDTASTKTLANVNRMASERGCDGWSDIFMGNRTSDMHEWGIKEVRMKIIELGKGE